MHHLPTNHNINIPNTPQHPIPIPLLYKFLNNLDKTSMELLTKIIYLCLYNSINSCYHYCKDFMDFVYEDLC